MSQLLESPAAAFGFIVLVVFLVLIYFTQREKAKVSQMRGPKRFSPSWSSGRSHRRRRRSSRGAGEFKPRWNRRSRDSETRRTPSEASAEATEDDSAHRPE